MEMRLLYLLPCSNLGGRRDCFVRNTDDMLVSMDDVDITDKVPRESLWVAAVSGLFAVGSGLCLVMMMTSDMRESMRRRYNSDVTASEGGEGGEHKRGLLSSSQTKHVVLTYHSVVNCAAKEVSDWTCSICLEDDEPDSDVRTVLLPCSHRFHRT